MTCKEHCIHYPVCKDTVADENWTAEVPIKIRQMYTPEGCSTFKPNLVKGTWLPYSTTMMECSVCGRHTARHRFEFCPHCGSQMLPKIQAKEESTIDGVQLSLFDMEVSTHE